jgi:dCMP deaminase
MEDFTNYIPPRSDVLFMKHVYLAAERSKDPRTKIGAVLVRDGNVIGTGYNGFARKVLDLPERYNDRETKYSFVVHAEANSVLTCARLGIPTLNSILYTNGIPCQECMKSVIQGGIKEIVVHKQWPNMTHSEKWIKSTAISKLMIEETGIKLRWLDEMLNMNGYLDGKIIKV